MSTGSTTSLVRDLALVGLALAATACGGDEPTDPQQAGRCGDPGSWPLASAPAATNGSVVAVVGDRVVARSTEDAEMLHIAGTCGESPVSLELTGEPVVAGGHVLLVGEAETLRVDPESGATNRAFGPVFREIHETPAGLLALGIGGKLLLDPDPTDAEEPTLLFEGGAWLPRNPTPDSPAWPHLWTDGTQTFALSTAFELNRVPLAGGDPVVELTEVEEFHVLDGGRRIAWRGLGGDMLTVTDLDTDTEQFSTPQDDGNWGAEQAGRWVLLTTDRGRLLDLDSSTVVEPVDFDPVRIVDTGTDRALLVGYPNGSPELGYWTIGADGELASFLPADPCLEFDSQVEPAGIVIPTGACDPLTSLYNPIDEMQLIPFGGGAPQPLGMRYGFSYQVLQDGFILSWAEEPGSGKGELSADSPDTEQVVLADEVTSGPPVVEGLDAYYFQLGRGVQRFTLDPG